MPLYTSVSKDLVWDPTTWGGGEGNKTKSPTNPQLILCTNVTYQWKHWTCSNETLELMCVGKIPFTPPRREGTPLILL